MEQKTHKSRLIDLTGKFVVFNKDISDIDLKTIQLKDTCYKCISFKLDNTFYNKYDKSVWYASLIFENNNIEIKLCFESEQEREDEILRLFTIIC